MKRFLSLSLIAAFLLAGYANAATTIRMAGSKAEGEPETVGMHKFGDYLKKLSNGKFEVKVYANGLLGKEDKYIADLRKGSIQMCATGTQVSTFHNAMAMFETPMMFDNYEHAHRAMNGKTFQLICDGFTAKSGLRALNAFPLGFRHFYTRKAIKGVADMKGLKLRVPNITLYTTFAKECGINGQAMPFAEVMSSVDQGVIDGGDSPLSDITTKKVYEKCPNITLTGHLLVIHSMFINEAFYQKLSAQEKDWFNKAAHMAAEDVWKLVAEADQKAIAEIKAHKGIVTEATPEMKKVMTEAAHRTWDMFLNPERKVSYVPNAKAIFDSAASYRK